MTPKTDNLKLDVLTEYIQRRDNFYQRLGGAWSRTLNQPTDILEPISVTVDDIAEINAAARGVMAVYSELAILVRQLPRSALERIGIPETLSSLVDTPSLIDDLLFARLDFIVNGDGIKMVDCNLDAPGLIVETFEINKLVCSEMRAANPNQMARQLLSKTLSGAVSSVSRFVGRPVGECNTAVIYGEGFDRDADAADFVRKVLMESNINAKTASVQDLEFDDDGIYDERAQRVHICVRLYPLAELLNAKIFHRGNHTKSFDAPVLKRLVQSRRVFLISTPFAAILESKVMQALTWKLYVEGVGFSERVRKFIRQYMLPTFFRRRALKASMSQNRRSAGVEAVLP